MKKWKRELDMEPGDLRINSRLREESGVPKSSPGPSYANDGQSVLHFRTNVRPPVITDGRLHHMHSQIPGNPLMLDRGEPVKVWRDPSLVNSGEIRHVISMQHYPPHPIMPHPSVSAGVNLYHHHHDNKPMDTSSRGMPLPNPAAEGLRGRAPIVYAPQPPPPQPGPPVPKPSMEQWRGGIVPGGGVHGSPGHGSVGHSAAGHSSAGHSAAGPSGPGPSGGGGHSAGSHGAAGPSSGMIPTPPPQSPQCGSSKDVRVNVSGKSTVEQAVHDHFVESLRLAQLKGTAPPPQPQPVVRPEDRLNSHPPLPHGSMQQRYYPAPLPDKRIHVPEMPTTSAQQQLMYQIHQHQAHQQHQLNKQELPAPPPLRSEAPYRGGPGTETIRKHQIYGAPEIMARAHLESAVAAAAAQQQQSNLRYEQEQMSRLEVHPSETSVRYQKLPPAPTPPRRPPTQNELQQQHERNRSPFGKQGTPAVSPNSFHMYPQAHIGKHKVNSPAPPHIYGKPGPTSRYDMGGDSASPLSLTSKGGLTRPSQSSPTALSHASPTLPQHDVRKTDVAYYMYNNGPPGFQQPSMSPQAHIHAIQTQPLDLGGKRKTDEEIYKGPIPDYSDHTPVKPTSYGSRKTVDDPRPPRPPNHISSSSSMSSSPLPLSLTVGEAPSKRKMEEAHFPLHLDTKKLRCDVPVTSGGANFFMSRKELEIKPTITISPHEFIVDKNRAQIDNHHQQQQQQHHHHHQVPMSLIVSHTSDIKAPRPDSAPSVHHYQQRQTPHPQPSTSLPPMDMKKPKPIVTIGVSPLRSDTPPQTTALQMTPPQRTPPAPVIPPATIISTVVSSPLCNGKHKESNSTVVVDNRNLTRTPDKKPEPENTARVVTSTTSSASNASAAPTPPSPPTVQKMPKKAWAIQWHEADCAKYEEANAVSTTTPNIPASSGGSEPSSSSSSTSAIATTSANSLVVKTVESKTSEESTDKLVNGHVSTTSDEGETKSVIVNSNTQSVNGFGKEKLNESDVGSENESDNSGKDKGLITDPSSSPKKTGRKGKDTVVGQAGSLPKPDLRKDGLCKRPPVSQLKKTGESFIQAETCNRVNPKIGKCRECRWHPSGRGSKKQSGAYCRFYGFRKLRYTKSGTLTVAGFSDPFTDPSKITEHDQFRLWLPSSEPPTELDVGMSKFLLSQLCDQFCDLVRQEEEARCLVCTQESSTIVWKPLLKGVREMCDVCDTTLFNFHWACGKCGFVVCLSCFKARKNESENGHIPENPGKDRDEFQWLLCSNRCAHELDKLMLVQTIAGDALTELNQNVHGTCTSWEISLQCDCKLLNAIAEGKDIYVNEANEPDKHSDASNDIKQEANDKGFKSSENDSYKTPKPKEEERGAHGGKTSNGCKATDSKDLEYFKRLITNDKLIRRKEFSLDKFLSHESSKLFPNVQHSWLCNGKLLRLLDPRCPENTAIFHELWKRGQPVLVSNVGEKLDQGLWTPESFSRDLGDYKSDLVNCVTGKIVPNQQMKKFWEGFTSVTKRLRDDKGEPMILKLRDFPPTDDFAQTLPSRFQDLMGVLPLPDYTLREGKLNMASRLPIEFMKSDLGPRMYIGYGASSTPEKGTTNLHLDISDTVNVLVYCEPPQDTELVEHNKAVMNAIKNSDCDVVTINRVLQNKEVPGAIWHVYDKADGDKIRNFLNKIAIEKGIQVGPHHDAIHEQSWYLDKKLRHRLQSECDITGYPILQFAGDAVFIPAGAPHQVCNLQNCIKVAEAFVSPENISHSFYLAEEEYRNLRRTHRNHEDKLQIKNIVYHAVKDAISVLLQNKEKSENLTKDTGGHHSNTFPKDCLLQPSTSPRELAPVV